MLELVQLEAHLQPSPIKKLDDQLFDECGIECWVKRDDLIHPVISGNKWRKLKYILRDVYARGCSHIISMGGAYSNHLHALAYIGQTLNIRTSAYIRGEQPAQLNSTLQDIQQWGMQLEFISRSQYRVLRQYRKYNALPAGQACDYWLVEGGASELALRGVSEIVTELEQDFDCIIVPCGTGTTAAGLISGAHKNTRVIGVAALKGAGFLNQDITRLAAETNNNWHIELDYHFGGFAKSTTELNAFITGFETQHAIPLEPIYSGKMFYALYDLARKGCFQRGQRILAIHTGGLQGKRS